MKILSMDYSLTHIIIKLSYKEWLRLLIATNDTVMLIEQGCHTISDNVVNTRCNDAQKTLLINFLNY